MHESGDIIQLRCSLMAVRNADGLYGVASITGEVKHPRKIEVHPMKQLFEIDIEKKLIIPDRRIFFYGAMRNLAKFYYGGIPLNLEDYKDRSYYQNMHHTDNFGYLLVPFDEMNLNPGVAVAVQKISQKIPDYLPIWASGMERIENPGSNDKRLHVADVPILLIQEMRRAKSYYYSKYEGITATIAEDSELSDLILADEPLGILPAELIEKVSPQNDRGSKHTNKGKSSIGIRMP